MLYHTSTIYSLLLTFDFQLLFSLLSHHFQEYGYFLLNYNKLVSLHNWGVSSDDVNGRCGRAPGSAPAYAHCILLLFLLFIVRLTWLFRPYFQVLINFTMSVTLRCCRTSWFDIISIRVSPHIDYVRLNSSSNLFCSFVNATKLRSTYLCWSYDFFIIY